MLANVGAGPGTEVTIVLEEATRGALPSLSGRWKKPGPTVHVLEAGLTELARLVGGSSGDTVLVAALSSISILDPAVLQERARAAGAQLTKFSVGNMPLEMFAASRERFRTLLEAAAGRAVPGAPLRRTVVEGALHDGIDLLEDLPGEVLFQNDLMDYFVNNLWLASHPLSERYHRPVARIPPLADRGSEARVAERASVRGSTLAAGVQVEGTVEDSVLFPNVIVRRNAHVTRSVILGGNRIGAGTEVHGALICPCGGEPGRPSPALGDNCVIGVRSSSMKNSRFPGHIRDGLAVIGMNADVPNGFRAEGGTYVAPGTGAAALRRVKVLRRGASVLAAGSPERPGEHAREAAG
jgi:hypothetical protein